MKKNLIIGLAAVLFLAVGIFGYATRDDTKVSTQPSVDEDVTDLEQAEQPVDDSEATQEKVEEKSDTSQTEEVPEVATPGQYVAYYDGAIQATEGNKILFFHADWCPRCLQLEEDILAQGVPEGTTIFEVNFDNSEGLRSKYGVNQQTTLVSVDDQGNELNQYSAYSNPSLQAVLDNLL